MYAESITMKRRLFSFNITIESSFLVNSNVRVLSERLSDSQTQGCTSFHCNVSMSTLATGFWYLKMTDNSKLEHGIFGCN